MLILETSFKPLLFKGGGGKGGTLLRLLSQLRPRIRSPVAVTLIILKRQLECSTHAEDRESRANGQSCLTKYKNNMHILKKWNVLKHFENSKNLFFCKFLSSQFESYKLCKTEVSYQTLQCNCTVTTTLKCCYFLLKKFTREKISRCRKFLP